MKYLVFILFLSCDTTSVCDCDKITIVDDQIVKEDWYFTCYEEVFNENEYIICN